jgi:hypothetical protein
MPPVMRAAALSVGPIHPSLKPIELGMLVVNANVEVIPGISEALTGGIPIVLRQSADDRTTRGGRLKRSEQLGLRIGRRLSHKPSEKTRSTLAEAHARAAVRDDLPTDHALATDEMADLEPTLRSDPVASPGVCATASTNCRCQ